jgi:hypothetical protein
MLSILIALAPVACAAQSGSGGAVAPSAATPPVAPVEDTLTVRMDRFRDLVWRPSDNYFRSPGPVRIELRSVARREIMVLDADDAEGTPDGDIVVSGRFRLVRGDAVVTGYSLKLNAPAETGSLRDAEARIGGMHIRGERLAMLQGRGMTVTGASFTTCEKTTPDYRITARELSLSDTGRVTARGVTLWIGRAPVLVVPTLMRSFRQKVESPFPLPSYSKDTGPKLRLSNDILGTPRASLTSDFVVSVRRPLQGNISFERSLGSVRRDAAPPAVRRNVLTEPARGALEQHPDPVGMQPQTRDADHSTVVYAALGTNEFVANRVRTDLRLGRRIEAGIVGHSPGRRQGSAVGDGKDASTGSAAGNSTASATGDVWGYHWGVGLGRYKETPTDAECNRAEVRAGLALRRVRLVPNLSLRAGLAGAGSLYGTGTHYGVVAPECEAVWESGRELALGVAVMRQYDSGKTPFVFDRADVRKEMRLFVRGDAARWGYSASVSYDLDRSRAYDTSFALLYRLDCLEFGLAYGARSQGLGVVLNLLPGVDHRERATNSPGSGAASGAGLGVVRGGR